MTMNDGISILLAIFVIVLVLRWLVGTTPSTNRRGHSGPHEQPRVRPRNITTEMVDTVRALFPDIPPAAIQHDLQKTGSVEVTCDNILQNGGILPLPPPHLAQSLPIPSTSNASTATCSSSSSEITQQSLIHKYNLHDAVSSNNIPEEPPKQWEDTSEKRQNLLQKRKEAMVLQARKRYLEQQQKNQEESQMKPYKISLSQDFEQSSTEEQLTPEARRQQILQATDLRMGFGGGKKS